MPKRSALKHDRSWAELKEKSHATLAKCQVLSCDDDWYRLLGADRPGSVVVVQKTRGTEPAHDRAKQISST
jgi:hypothetical protein